MRVFNLLVLFILLLSAMFMIQQIKVDKKTKWLLVVDAISLALVVSIFFIGIMWLTIKLL